MAGKGVLTVKVVGDTKDVESKLGGIGKKAGLAFAAVGTAAAAGAVASLNAFVGFERQMNEVFTLLPGISDKAMADMTGQVKDFSKEFGVLPDKVVPALYQSLSAGVPQDNVFEFLETAQKAAKGGVTDLTTAVDGISSVVNAYGSEVMDATQASDLMFTAVKLGKTDFNQLSSSLFNVTPTASALGVEFQDVTAALAAMTAQGTPTSVATTQLRSLFVELSKAGGGAAKTFEKMAGKTFSEFVKSGGRMDDALLLMKEAADDAGVGLGDMFGSVEAGAAALSLTKDNASVFADNINAMGESAGATDKAFRQMDKGLGPVFDKIKANLSVFMIDIGQKLAPIVETAMQRAGEAFNVVSDWWTVNGPAITAAAQMIAAVMVEAFNVIVGAIGYVVEHWDTFKFVILGAIAVLLPAFAAFVTGVVIWEAAVVAAWIKTHVQAVASTVIHSAQVVKQVASWVLLGVQSTLHAMKVAAAWLIAIGPIAIVIAAVAGLVVVIVKNWDTIKSTIAAGWEAVKGATSAAWDAIKGAVSAAIGFIVTVLTNFTGPGLIIKHWGTIKGATSAAWEGIKGFVSGGVNAIVGFITSLPGRITSSVAGAFDGLWRSFANVVNRIINSWNGLKFQLPSFEGKKMPGPIPDIPGWEGPTLRVPQIPRLHTGGAFRSLTPGGEGLALLRDREVVTTPEAPSGPAVVRLDEAQLRELARMLTQMARAS